MSVRIFSSDQFQTQFVSSMFPSHTIARSPAAPTESSCARFGFTCAMPNPSDFTSAKSEAGADDFVQIPAADPVEGGGGGGGLVDVVVVVVVGSLSLVVTTSSG